MKKLIKIVSFILCGALLFSLFACKSGNNTGGLVNVIDTDNENDKYLIRNFKTEYSIVIPESASSIITTAATELSDFLYKASGVYLPVKTDAAVSYDTAKKHISLGNTKILKGSGISNELNELKESGYKLSTKGFQIIVAGATDTGTLYGIYKLLNYMIDFEAYAIDEVYYKQATSIFVYDFKNLKFVPDIDVKHLQTPSASNFLNVVNLARMGVISSYWAGHTLEGQYFGGGLNVHSMFKVMPPATYLSDHSDWYLVREKGAEQLCLTNEEMTKQFIENLIGIIENSPASKYYNLGNEDGWGVCRCQTCTAVYRQYDESTSASLIYCRFLNKVSEAVDDWLLEEYPERYGQVSIGGLAYFGYAASPTNYDDKTDTHTPIHEDAVLRDNVFIQFATHDSCMAHAINDGDCNFNDDFYRNLQGWASVSNHMKIYNYNACMDELFMFYNNFGSFQGNLQVFKELNVDYIYVEGNRNDNGPFDELKQYLFAKLSIDSTLNFDKLVTDFISNYYKDASGEIYEFYKKLRDNFNITAKNNNQNICIGVYSYNPPLPIRKNAASYWSMEFLSASMELFDKAFEKVLSSELTVEEKETVRMRVLSLQMSVRYFIIKYYSGYYSPSELEAVKAQFLADAKIIDWRTNTLFSSTINF